MTKSHLSSYPINAKKLRLFPFLAALICGSLLTAVLLTTLNPVRPALAATGPLCYVNAAASGANNGDIWNDAYTDLQPALTDANCTEIWVATGVYTPGLSQSDTFTLTSGISLYGGFVGTESQRAERDWEANVTILSGDIDGDDITDASGVVTMTDNISGTNSYHVVWADGVTQPITESTVLDGFTITAGQANDIDWPDDSGGGFYCDGGGSGSECSPSLSNVTFSGNAAIFGGAMYNDGWDSGVSSPDLSDVTFSGNTAYEDGGAMYNDGTDGGVSSPSLNNVTFSNNSATTYSGGAMFNDGWDGTSDPSLSDVIFSSNTANEDGGAMFNGGAFNGESNPSLVNVTFTDNTTGDSGGAMYNIGLDGGVSSPSLVNVTFIGNTTNDSGGAMYNHGDTGGTSMPTLSNVVFSGNLALDKGGAMSNYVNDGGVSMPTLVNVTFSGNSATYGGAIASYSNNGGTNTPSLSNVIVWGNTAVVGTQLYNFTATPSISYSLIQSDTDAIFNSIGSSILYGPNVLTSDPRFVDDDGADNIAGTLDDDLHLLKNSPAIDAGDNDAISQTTDLDGNARFYDDTAVTDTGSGTAPIVDMGAYERQSDSWTILYLPIVAKGN